MGFFFQVVIHYSKSGIHAPQETNFFPYPGWPLEYLKMSLFYCPKLTQVWVTGLLIHKVGSTPPFTNPRVRELTWGPGLLMVGWAPCGMPDEPPAAIICTWELVVTDAIALLSREALENPVKPLWAGSGSFTQFPPQSLFQAIACIEM